MRSLAVIAAACLVSLAACASIAGLEAPGDPAIADDNEASTSTTSSSSSGSSGSAVSSGGPVNPLDATSGPPPGNDAASPTTDTGSPTAPDIAHYELRCNGQVLNLRSCASGKQFEHEYCSSSGGNRVVILANTGTLPVAYIARSGWNGGTKYVPSESTGGGSNEKVGTLSAGQTADLSDAWGGGYLMLLGSTKPFTTTFATSPKEGEGQINYSAKGQIGGVPTNVMYIAQVTSGPTPYGNCFSTTPFY